MFKFTEIEPNDIVLQLERELSISTQIAQYRIDSTANLDEYDFHDEKKYRAFFEAFARYANSRWNEKTTTDWEFEKFPYRESVDTLRGIYRVLKTGGAYSDGRSDEETSEIEQRTRKALQRDSDTLIIFCTSDEDFREEDVSGGFGVPNEILDLKLISSWFQIVAWDGLMFTLNPKYNRLTVIAYTDTD